MPASKAQQAVTAKRRAQAIALRMAGMDFETIAERLGYANRGAATKDFWRTVKAHRLEEQQAVDELREVEGQRLDRLQAAVWAKAVKGDLKAVETVLKVIAQRARLFGLDAPVRAEVSGPDGGPIALATGSLEDAERLFNIIQSVTDDEDFAIGDEDVDGEGDQDERGNVG